MAVYTNPLYRRPRCHERCHQRESRVDVDEMDEARQQRFIAMWLRYMAARAEMIAATIDATRAMNKLAEAWKRGEEIDFLELVYHYDE